MIRPDIPTMMTQLNALAEVFDKKPLGEKAAMVWFDTLNDFATEKVLGVLIGWPRTHTKFPAPAEVRKSLGELMSDDIERKAAADRRAAPFNPGVGGAQAEKFIAQIRKTLNQPKWTPVEHWQRVLKTQKKGSIGYEYATKALIMKGVLKDPTPALEDPREAGQDDEERAVNF